MSSFFAHKSPTPEPEDEPLPPREPDPEEDPAPHPDPVMAPMPYSMPLDGVYHTRRIDAEQLYQPRAL